MTTKNNIPLILGFSIPVLMILFVAVSIYVPGLFIHPKYNFLYSADGDYYGSQVYLVNEGHLIENLQKLPLYLNGKLQPNPQLYVYNLITNESTLISVKDVQNLKLDPNIESPDGYKLEHGNQSDGFFPFLWSRRDYNNTEYLVGHNTSKRINIKSKSSDYYNSIHFLGWII